MNDITEYDKRIYNEYLASIAAANNRPYRRRVNFDNLKDDVYVTLKRLSHMLRDTHIDLKTFFSAPYSVHTDVKFQPLKFYLSSKAVITYTIIVNNRARLGADSVENLEYVKSGLKFVYEYCAENNLTLDEYKTSVTDNNIPTALLHLQQHKINFYIVHLLDMQCILYKLGVDWLTFFISDFENLFRDTKVKYNKSEQLKPIATKAIGAIQRKLETNKIQK